MATKRLREREDGSLTPLSREERRDLYKLISLHPRRPDIVGDLPRWVWGMDIFLWQLPLLKLTLALNVLFWWLLA